MGRVKGVVCRFPAKPEVLLQIKSRSICVQNQFSQLRPPIRAKLCEEPNLARRSADIPVRSGLENLCSLYESKGFCIVRGCCGQECPRSAADCGVRRARLRRTWIFSAGNWSTQSLQDWKYM